MMIISTSPEEIIFNFLPMKKRRITREGITFPDRRYWHDDLTDLVGKGQHEVKEDPRDISVVYVRARTGQIVKVPAVPPLPRMSLGEWKRLRKRHREVNRNEVLTVTKLEGVIEADRRVKTSKAATKAARKNAAREEELLRASRQAPPASVQPPIDGSSMPHMPDFDPTAPRARMDVEMFDI